MRMVSEFHRAERSPRWFKCSQTRVYIESVRSQADSMIRQYQEESPTDLSWMESRAFDLIMELPVLAQGAKSIELKMKLQITTGYLNALGSSGAAALATSMDVRKSLIRK